MSATDVLEGSEVLAMPRYFDQLWDEYGPGLQSAKLAAIEAQAATATAYGDWAP